jgi:hypothetical protein
MFFLTELDPNARVKGTRDPLGIQSVWSGFARLVVGGITSQTSSLDDFRILVMGSWLIDQVADDSIPKASIFACWEQLAAYARLEVHGQGGFRGITRVRNRLERSKQCKEPIQISSSRSDQILTNQAGYGIWGLYRSTAWSTGLLSREKPMVARPEVLMLVRDTYVPLLEPTWGKDLATLLRWVTEGHELRPWKAEDRRRLESIARSMTGPVTAAERALYREFLVEAGPDDVESIPRAVRRRQRALVSQLRARGTSSHIGRDDLRAVAASTDDSDLEDALESMLAGGALLGAAARIFAYLSQQADTTIAAEAAHLEEHFSHHAHLLSTSHLARLRAVTKTRPTLLDAPADDTGHRERWLQIATALHDKDFEAILTLLVAQNELVSRARGGATGWVTVSSTGTVKVNITDTGPALPEDADPDGFWIEPYYVGNLLNLSRAVEVA